MPDANRFVRGAGVIPRRVAGETILVPSNARSVTENSRAAELFVLNESGELLWSELSTPQSVPDLARKLMNAYAVSVTEAEADAATFVESLASIGAVTPA